MFSQEARDKATAIVTQIADRHPKDLFIETIKEGPDGVEEQANLSRKRFNNYKIGGVYVVFSKQPKFFRIEVGNETLAELEHAFKFNDAVLRHLTVKMREAVTGPSPMMKEEKSRNVTAAGEEKKDEPKAEAPKAEPASA